MNRSEYQSGHKESGLVPDPSNWVFDCALGVLCLVSILAALGLFYYEHTSPVRDLYNTPGIKLVRFKSGPQPLPHEVAQVEIHDRHITSQTLQPILDLPNLEGVFFYSCEIDDDAARLLAKCPP